MADGLQEMGLAETDPAVNEEWIVGAGRGFGHGQAGSVGEFTVDSDHEGIKDVMGIEPPDAGSSGCFRRFFGLDGFGGNNRLTDVAVFDPEGNLPFGPENGHQRSLQLRAVIALDPNLVNAVRNNQGDLARIGLGQAQGGKPPVVNSLPQFRPQGR